MDAGALVAAHAADAMARGGLKSSGTRPTLTGLLLRQPPAVLSGYVELAEKWLCSAN